MHRSLLHHSLLHHSLLHRFILASAALTAFLLASQTALRAEPATLAAAGASFAANKFDQARKSYAALVKADPKQTAPYPGLIESLLRLDRWQEAVRVGQTAAAADPANADVRGLLAMAEIRAGQPEAALTDAKLALARDKDNYWGLVASGRVAAWDGHRKEGSALFMRATALHPERPDAWLGAWQTQTDVGFTEADRQIAVHYLALAPKGQPFDFNTAFIENLVKNETAYWKTFDADPPFHLDKDDEKQASYTAIFPIQRSDDSVLVSVGINGKPYNLLFDTGAEGILLSAKSAKRLDLTNMAQSYVAGVQGKSAASLQRADTLTLGSVTLHSIPLRVTGGYNGPGDGLFGGPILSDYAVTFDFDNNTMIIARGPGAGHIALSHTSTATAPLHRFASHLFVSIHTKHRQVWAMLDTGAATDVFSLDLTHELSKDTSIDDWRQASVDQRVGIGDSSMRIDYCLTPEKLEIAFDGSTPPATLTQVGMIGQSSIDHQVSPSFDFEIGMLLGVPLLSHHSRVTIDYPHHLLTFEDPLP